MKIFICLCLVSLAVAKRTFYGDEVLTLYPTNSDQVNLIKGLNKDVEMVDFWNPKYPSMVTPNHAVDIRVPSGIIPSIKKFFLDNGINYQVKIDDVQALIDNQFSSTKELSKTHDYQSYNNYETIAEWADQMQVAHPGLASTWSLGTSYAGKDIPIITISTKSTNPEMVVDCGFHAREWISPAFCQCYTNYLLEGYGTDPEITKILDGLTIHIIPVVNVDGYEYSHTDDRMWRKTRSNYGTPCDGVDPNRNFDAAWGGAGSSASSCTQTFQGPHFESEPEVKAVADFVKRKIGTLKAYVSFHAYSQLVLFPYSYTIHQAKTHDDLNALAQQASEAVSRPYGTKYVYGASAAIAYAAAGGSNDFAYDAGVPLSYTIELRDTGEFGFLLPAGQIKEVCDETYNMMRVFENAARTV